MAGAREGGRRGDTGAPPASRDGARRRGAAAPPRPRALMGPEGSCHSPVGKCGTGCKTALGWQWRGGGQKWTRQGALAARGGAAQRPSRGVRTPAAVARVEASVTKGWPGMRRGGEGRWSPAVAGGRQVPVQGRWACRPARWAAAVVAPTGAALSVAMLAPVPHRWPRADQRRVQQPWRQWRLSTLPTARGRRWGQAVRGACGRRLRAPVWGGGPDASV